MIKLTPENLKFGFRFFLALWLAVPTCLVAQQAVTPTAILSKGQTSVIKPVYDVATIKRGNWGLHGGALETEMGFTSDSFIAKEMELVSLVCAAYGVDSYQVSGGPDWARDGHDGYDVVAKTTEDSTVEMLRKMGSKQAMLVQEEMLQALLADRFKLIVHRETKQLPMSVLVVSKGGLKIQTSKQAAIDPNAPQGADDSPRNSMTMENATGDLLVTAKDYSMDSVAGWLAAELRHPVKNMTGLSGSYDFKVHYLPQYLASDPSADSFMVPPLTTAIQEQLGLRIESRTGSVETIVIDHAERPSAN